jgi:hypothetical protein
MLKQKATLAVILASVSCVAAQTPSTPQADSAAPSQVIMMVNLAANIDKGIDAKKTKAGDPFTAKVSTAGKLNDGTIVPIGSLLQGRIDSVTPSENKGDSTLVLTIDKLQIKNGKELPIKATIVSITSTTPTFGNDDKTYDPSSYRPGTIGDNKSNGQNSQNGAPAGPHPIEGLTLSGSPKDATSATLTQAKKNIHLSNATQIVVSAAVVHAGAVLK